MASGGSDKSVEIDHLLHLHSTMVDTITAAENRRQNYSTLSFGLISAGFALFGSDIDIDKIFISVPVLAISITWLVTVRFFAKLAKAKWDVVDEIEEELNVQPFRREWELFRASKSKLDIGPAKLEQFTPILAILTAGSYIAFRVADIFCRI